MNIMANTASTVFLLKQLIIHIPRKTEALKSLCGHALLILAKSSQFL